MPIDDSNWLERRAAEVRQRAIARRRGRLDRAQVIGRLSSIESTPRERLAEPHSTGQLDVPGAGFDD
jgi:hypothetical protein